MPLVRQAAETLLGVKTAKRVGQPRGGAWSGPRAPLRRLCDPYPLDGDAWSCGNEAGGGVP